MAPISLQAIFAGLFSRKSVSYPFSLAWFPEQPAARHILQCGAEKHNRDCHRGGLLARNTGAGARDSWVRGGRTEQVLHTFAAAIPAADLLCSASPWYELDSDGRILAFAAHTRTAVRNSVNRRQSLGGNRLTDAKS